MEKRRIEVFTGNCPLCDETVLLVEEMADSNCEVLIYDLKKGEEYPMYLEMAKHYGVNAVPAIAIDGILVLIGKSKREQLEAAGIGQSNVPLGIQQLKYENDFILFENLCRDTKIWVSTSRFRS